MFDFITTPIETAFTWFGYALLFGAFITTLLVLAIPIGMKMLGVAFAKTIVTELVKQLPLEKITLDAHTLKNYGGSVLRSIK